MQRINNERVRIDVASWYFTDHTISIALVNRFRADVIETPRMSPCVRRARLIKGAINIPVTELEKRLGESPKDQMILTA